MRSELRIAALLSLAGWFACASIAAQQWNDAIDSLEEIRSAGGRLFPNTAAISP